MERAKEKATEKATKEVIVQPQPPPRNATGRLCRENRPLLSWFEEAMKEKSKPIEEALSTVKGNEVTKCSAITTPREQETVSRLGGSIPGDKANRDDKGEQKDDGWQVVRSRKHIMQQANLRNPPPRKTPTQVEKAFSKAFIEKKCFRCLSVGHKRASCREPVRCFKCHKVGHMAGRCSLPIKQTIQTGPKPQALQRNKKQGETYAQVTRNKQKMEVVEQYLDERPEVEDVFIPEMTDPRPENEYLQRSAMVVLEMDADYQNKPVQITNPLVDAITNALVVRTGSTPSRYRVMATDKSLLVICENTRWRDRLVGEPIFRIIELGVRFYLRAWRPTIDMAYQPPGYQTWLRLTGLPLHLWNDDGIKRATARIGIVKHIRPYGIQGGQMKHITVYMATNHPRGISKTLEVRVGSHTRAVQVKLLGWRLATYGHFPPPDLNQPTQLPQPGQYDYQWQDQMHQPTANTPLGSGVSNAYNYVPTNECGAKIKKDGAKKGGVSILERSRPNQIRVQKRGVVRLRGKQIGVQKRGAVRPRGAQTTQQWIPRDWVKLLGKESKLKSQMVTTQGLHNKRVTATRKITIKVGSSVTCTLEVQGGKNVRRKLTLQPVTDITDTPGQLILKCLTLLKKNCTSKEKSEKIIGKRTQEQSARPRIEYKVSSYEVHSLSDGIANSERKYNSWSAIGDWVFGQCNTMKVTLSRAGMVVPIILKFQIGEGPLNLATKTYLLTMIPHANSLTNPTLVLIEGPPPGFEDGPKYRVIEEIDEGPPGFENGPNYQAQREGVILNQSLLEEHGSPLIQQAPSTTVNQKGTGAIRKSPRLQAKTRGPYISAIEKAKIVKGYQPEKEGKQKRGFKLAKPPVKPNLNYMETLNPLSEIQAHLIIEAAGIEMKEDLSESISKMVKDQPLGDGPEGV